jgi:hypothetical protein
MQENKTIFDVIKNLSFDKNIHTKEEDLKLYESFVINKSFSLYQDTIFYANEMNINNQLPDKMKYDYYMSSIRKRKRWTPWPKKNLDNEIIDLISKAYNVNFKNAISINKLLTPEQIEVIKLKYREDNKNNDKKSE